MMQVFERHTEIPEPARHSVVVIGNFDGVHKGHQALLDKAKTLAAEHSAFISVLTFEPHPRFVFRPDDPPFRLTPAPLKIQKLEEAGVDFVFSLPFDWNFASRSAQNFIQSILIEGLAAKAVVVGSDFRFGQMRKGTPDMIEVAGVPVTLVDPVTDESGQVISSSRIRQALRHGKPEKANRLLGWQWEISGNVVKGDQRGRDLGYPTANFPLNAQVVHPAYGVYAARVRIEDEDIWHPAAINIGIRPMFEIPKAQVESYIFDFNREIYGRVLHVRPLAFLRSEAKFESLEALIEQMDEDCKQAWTLLE